VRWLGLSAHSAEADWWFIDVNAPPPPFPAGAAGFGMLGPSATKHLGDGKAPFICSIWLESRQCSVRREESVLQKAPLSTQAAFRFSVGDGDGAHSW